MHSGKFGAQYINIWDSLGFSSNYVTEYDLKANFESFSLSWRENAGRNELGTKCFSIHLLKWTFY